MVMGILSPTSRGGPRMKHLLTQLLPEPLFLVECYWPGVTPAELAVADDRARCVEAGDGGSPVVRYAGSILVPTDELVFRLFVGGSVELVAAANKRAAIPFERVIDAVAINPSRPEPGDRHD